jgi:hypothetical protein
MNFLNSKTFIAIASAITGATLTSLYYNKKRKVQLVKKSHPVDRDTICSKIVKDLGSVVPFGDIENKSVDTTLDSTSNAVTTKAKKHHVVEIGPLMRQLAQKNNIDYILQDTFKDKKDAQIHIVAGQKDANFYKLWLPEKLLKCVENPKKEFIIGSAIETADTDFQWVVVGSDFEHEIQSRVHALLNLSSEADEKEQMVFDNFHFIPHTMNAKELNAIILKYGYRNKPLVVTTTEPSAWWSNAAEIDLTWFFGMYDDLSVEDALTKARKLGTDLRLKVETMTTSSIHNSDVYDPVIAQTLFEHCKDRRQFGDLVMHFYSHSLNGHENDTFNPINSPKTEENLKASVDKLMSDLDKMDGIDNVQILHIFQAARSIGFAYRYFSSV